MVDSFLSHCDKSFQCHTTKQKVDRFPAIRNFLAYEVQTFIIQISNGTADTVFYLEFKQKSWTTLGNSTKTITRMSWELDLRKISKIV